MRFEVSLVIDSCMRRPEIVPVPGATAPGIRPGVLLHRVLPEPPEDVVTMWVEAGPPPLDGNDSIVWDATWTVQVDSGLRRNAATIDLPMARVRRLELVVGP